MKNWIESDSKPKMNRIESDRTDLSRTDWIESETKLGFAIANAWKLIEIKSE